MILGQERLKEHSQCPQSNNHQVDQSWMFHYNLWMLVHYWLLELCYKLPVRGRKVLLLPPHSVLWTLSGNMKVVFLSIRYTMLEWQKMMAVSLQGLMVRMAQVLLAAQLGHVYLLLIPWSGILWKHHLLQPVRDQLKSWMQRLNSCLVRLKDLRLEP